MFIFLWVFFILTFQTRQPNDERSSLSITALLGFQDKMESKQKQKKTKEKTESENRHIADADT